MKLSKPAALAVVAFSCLPWCGAEAQADVNYRVISTKSAQVGRGAAWVYVALDLKGAPLALGVTLDKNALAGLPEELNMASRCFGGTCLGDYERLFAVPDGEAAKAVAPFKWIGLNWNPKGHGAPAPPPWAEPHFDFHFYIADRTSIMALRPGSCGEMIDCDDFKKATKPVPTTFVHRDHIDVGAAVPAMGNHLIDSKSPELAPGGPKFTHTFIFGANDGHIAFYEPMITRAFLASRPITCLRIKQPDSWEVSGRYPTKYCVRYSSRTGRYTVSLEGFVDRAARQP